MMIDLKKELDEARAESRAFFLKKYIDVNVDWNFIVNEIDESLLDMEIEEMSNTYVWKQEKAMLLRDLFYMQLSNKFPTKIDSVNEVAKEFAQAFWGIKNYPLPRVCYFVNLASRINDVVPGVAVPKHCDAHDAIFIQLVNETRWNIYKSQDDAEPIQSEILTPGDIIIIPKGVYHELDPKTPRAGVQLTYPDDWKRFLIPQ